jgi:hypothetical protein
MLHSGIDLHKRTIVLSTVDPQGARVADTELPASRAAVRSYFAAHPGPHRAVVESTATWYWLRDLLIPLGVDLKLGHAPCASFFNARSHSMARSRADP